MATTLTGLDGLTYTKVTTPITTLLNPNTTNYYGVLNTECFSFSGGTVASVTNSGIVLGGGGSAGNAGKNAFTNASTITTFTNTGAFLGGGGGGGGGAGAGGAGGGGGGGNGAGIGGSIFALPTTGGNSGSGGGPGQNGSDSGGYKGGVGGGNFGGNGGYSLGYPSAYPYGGNSTKSIFTFGGGGGAWSENQFGSGGGGYGGGNGGDGYNSNGGGGGGGGRGGTNSTNTNNGGNGGYGLFNSGTITTLVNGQGGSGYLYGPLFYAGTAPTSYNIIITSATRYGQLYCTGVTTTTGSMTFNIDSTSTIPANTTSLILQNVLVGITPSNLNGTVTISSKSYTWYLVAQDSSSPTTYDLNIKLTSVLTGYRTNAIDLAFTQTNNNLSVSSLNFNNTTYSITNTGDISANSLTIGSNGITNTGAITGTSLNLGSTGTITSGQINSSYVVQSYPITSTNTTPANTFLGTFVSSQNGSSINVKVISHSGFNGSNSQDFSIDIYFKTADGNAANLIGGTIFGGNGYHILYDNKFNTNLRDYSTSNIYWVANAAGVNATNFSLYMYNGNYNNNSIYTVTYSNGSSWSTSIQNASPNPPANTSTCLLSTLISPLSSSASNTDVTFKAITGSSVSLGTASGNTITAGALKIGSSYGITNAGDISGNKMNAGAITGTSVSLGTGTNKTIINDNSIAIGRTRDPAFALDVSGRFFCTFDRDNNISKFFTMQQYIVTGTTGAYLDTQGGLNVSWNLLSHSDGTNPGTGTYLGSGMTEFTNYAGYGAKGTYSDSSGGFSFWTAIARSPTTSSTYLANINVGSIHCPGTITCGRVNSNYVVQTYGFANTSNTTANICLGTFTPSGGGASIHVKLVGHSGYTCNNTEDYNADIYFKTGNGVNLNGAGFNGNAHHIKYDNTFNTNLVIYGDLPVYWVGNAAGGSATTYSLYVYQARYNENSFYTVTYSKISSWSTAATNALPATPSNTSTCLVSTLITPLSSSASNTDVTFKGISGTSLSITGRTDVKGGLLVPFQLITTNNQTISSAYSGGFVNIYNAASTVNLFSPDAFGSGNPEQPFITIWNHRNANSVIISQGRSFLGSGASGNNTLVIFPYQTIQFVSTGNDWIIVSRNPANYIPILPDGYQLYFKFRGDATNSGELSTVTASYSYAANTTAPNPNATINSLKCLTLYQGGDYVYFPAFGTSNATRPPDNFSVCVWVYFAPFPGGVSEYQIFSIGDRTFNDTGSIWQTDVGGSQINTATNVPTRWLTATYTAPLDTTNWNHYAFTSSTVNNYTTIIVYRNGVRVAKATNATAGSWGSTGGNTYHFTLGRCSDSAARYFVGCGMHDFLYYNRTLSAAEVYQVMNITA